MLKVRILDRCPYCDGQTYLPAGEATNWKGKTYTRYESCQIAMIKVSEANWLSCPSS